MKLVRDLIPDIITRQQKTCSWRWIKDNDEHRHFLKLKMLEEIDEFIVDPCYEEAADIFEVFRALCALHGLDLEAVQNVAEAKKEQRGGFMAGVILEDVYNESR